MKLKNAVDKNIEKENIRKLEIKTKKNIKKFNIRQNKKLANKVNDQASFWRVYRKITKNETESNIQIIDNNNKIFETDEDISEHFNEMFIDCFIYSR